MTTTPSTRLATAARRVVDRFADGDVASVVAGCTDDALLEILSEAAAARDVLDLVLAASSAEIARRSARDLGYAGLAQRKGHRNVTSLVQNVTGQTRADVGRSLRTGDDILASVEPDAVPISSEAPAPPARPTWLIALRDALASGRIGQAHFQAIRVGLGDPPVDRYPELSPDFLPSAWVEAVARLLDEAPDLPAEELRAAARIARDRLDPIGVTLRFEDRFHARSFRRWIDEDGQHHAKIAFDDDAAAWVDAILSATLRPRRGPRFVDAPSPRDRGESDERSNEQLQYDTLMAILRTGAAADPDQAFGDRQPGVRIILDATAIAPDDDHGGTRVRGTGHLEDGGQAVPGGVVETYLCDAGTLPITLDGAGRPLDVGRDHRLFTRTQRIAIAARDGGCLWTGCTAPASWCEVHHIDHWWEDHGRTDVDDGVPLCRNCHLRLHNQGWRITRQRDPVTALDAYWLHAPPDPVTAAIPDPVLLSSKSPRRFRAA